MRNRAKCKLCSSIIESKDRHDHVSCECGEIAVDGGSDYFRCGARSFDNFIRIDDQGNEVKVKIVESDNDSEELKEKKPPTKEELLQEIEGMISSIERLPQNAMVTSVTQYDLLSLLYVISSLFKVSDSSSS